jgi:hypothetical protein
MLILGTRDGCGRKRPEVRHSKFETRATWRLQNDALTVGFNIDSAATKMQFGLRCSRADAYVCIRPAVDPCNTAEHERVALRDDGARTDSRRVN